MRLIGCGTSTRKATRSRGPFAMPSATGPSSADSHNRCKTRSWSYLQRELEENIQAAFKEARTKLLENFDDEVQRKLRLRSQETNCTLSRYGDWLWQLTLQELAGCATSRGRGFGSAGAAARRDARRSCPAGKYRLLNDAATTVTISTGSVTPWPRPSSHSPRSAAAGRRNHVRLHKASG